MVHPARERSSRTPTLSTSLVARARASTPRNPLEDHVGDREKPYVGKVNRGMRSLFVKDIKENNRKEKDEESEHISSQKREATWHSKQR